MFKKRQIREYCHAGLIKKYPNIGLDFDENMKNLECLQKIYIHEFNIVLKNTQ